MIVRLALVIACLGACSGDEPDGESIDATTASFDGGDLADAARSDGGAPGDAAAIDAGFDIIDGGLGLVPGTLAVSWMHGAPNCNNSDDPALQTHAYNETTYIFRQDKCRTFEAPFVYLLIGDDTALLLDTGATNTVTIRDTVRPLIGDRTLVVAHSHAHGDHVASDARFEGQRATTLVGLDLASVQEAFSIETWPEDQGQLDLGGRILDILAIPGHELRHIAIYDRQAGLLLTGDTLYPGLLFINDWDTYRTSVQRLAAFAASHPIAHVLGAHIEMTSTPMVNYDYGTIYQPAEHVLELTAAHVAELDLALTELGSSPPSQAVAHDDFVIDPQ